MPTYRVDFVDHGKSVYYTEEVERDDDKAVMEHMRRSFGSLRIGAGFNIWDGKRLVDQHRNNGAFADPGPQGRRRSLKRPKPS